jgi:hypothetical protein
MSSDEEIEVQETALPSYRVRFSDMSEDLQQKATRHIATANGKGKLDKEVATYLKDLLDKDNDLKDECAGWHVIVGKSFASSLSYSTKHIYFMDLLENCNKTFLIFQTS